MLAAWHALVHFLGIDYGLPYGAWGWYNMWSGVAGSFVVNIVTFWYLFWWRGTCHHAVWCLRHGRHEAAGGLFKLCWKHHPDLGVRPHGKLIRELHLQWKAGEPANPRKG